MRSRRLRWDVRRLRRFSPVSRRIVRLRPKLQRQGLRIEWMWRLVRVVRATPDVFRGNLRLQTGLWRQGVRLGRLRWELRYVRGERDVQPVGGVRVPVRPVWRDVLLFGSGVQGDVVLHGALLGQGVRRRRLRRDVRIVRVEGDVRWCWALRVQLRGMWRDLLLVRSGVPRDVLLYTELLGEGVRV